MKKFIDELWAKLIWTSFFGLVFYIIWNYGNNMPALAIISIFLISGAISFFGTIFSLLKYMAISVCGKPVCGYVLRTYSDSEVLTNDSDVYADILIGTDYNDIRKYSSYIGTDWNTYRVGDFVKVKRIGESIKILRKIEEQNVPIFVQQLLASNAKNF